MVATRSFGVRPLLFFLCCAVYAFFGTPTPSSFGWAEAVIAGLLVLSLGFGGMRGALPGVSKNSGDFVVTSGRALLLYGLSVTLCMAVLRGHGVSAILRDVIPFVWLFLPLMAVDLIGKSGRNFPFIVAGAALIGVVFSLRSLMDREALVLAYLENMPTVLFAALLMLGVALTFLLRRRNYFIAAVCFILSLAPIFSMLETQQRASLGAVVLYIFVIVFYCVFKRPTSNLKNLIICFILASSSVFFAHAEIVRAWAVISEKTAAVGLNMRPQEMAAVWAVATRDVSTFLFGLGWGGHFHSPAVGGVSVNFTHNFFSSMLLKCGFVGVVLSGVYVFALLQKLSQVVRLAPVIGIALLAPILIDVTLYASFKSLDFGLMLLMVRGSLVYFENSRTESKQTAERTCADPLLCS